MSSPTKEDLLKSGHFPAKIAGGMRIAQREKKTSEKEFESNTNDNAVNSNDEETDYRQTNNILASTGLAGKTKKEFPEEAIRAFHEKHHAKHEPVHETRHTSKIFQPRKN